MKHLSIITFLIFSANLSAQTTLTSFEEIEHCTQPEKVKVIMLFGKDLKGFKEFPKKIYAFINLKELQIKRADLNNLDFDFSRFKLLEGVQMESCYIDSFPISLLECPNIRYIDLSQNQIDSIPEQIKNLKNLNQLFLDKNKDIKLPKNISKLKHLKYLEISGCQLTEIPAWVFSCKSLTDLIIGKNPIKEIPPGIGKLVNLKQFTLDETQISDLPLELKKCTKLERIYIKATPLSKNEKRVKELEKELGKTLVLYPTMF